MILDATHVLTAAHCVFNETTGQASAPGEIEVLAGAVNLDTVEHKEATAQEDPVSIASFEPEWKPAGGGLAEHDVGVLTLEEPGPHSAAKSSRLERARSPRSRCWTLGRRASPKRGTSRA